MTKRLALNMILCLTIINLKSSPNVCATISKTIFPISNLYDLTVLNFGLDKLFFPNLLEIVSVPIKSVKSTNKID